jgi:hypothetical protein
MCKLLDNLSEPIQVCIIPFPFIIVLDMNYLSLDVTAMNRTLGYIQTIQAVHKDTRHAFGKAYFAHPFQLWQTQFKRFDEILHIHRILARLVQEYIQIERLIIIVAIANRIIHLTIFRDLYNGLILLYQ